jgi:hypothetical protein
MARKAKRSTRRLTASEREKYQKIRESLSSEKDEILAEARRRKKGMTRSLLS